MNTAAQRLDCKGEAIPEDMHEYAFDVKLFAVVRVVARTKTDGIEAMKTIVESLDLSEHWIAGFNSKATGLRITEVSLSQDGEDENETPFEIDGEEPRTITETTK